MGRVVVKRSKLLEQLRALGATQKHVAVGVIGQKATEHAEQIGPDGQPVPSPLTVAEVAHMNHYGTSTAPARPFMLIAMHLHQDELRRLQARLGLGLLQGKLTLEQALGLLGEATAAKIKQTIADGKQHFTPNAPATVARKGGDTPLINFGQLRGAITYAVRNSDDGEG